MGNASAVTISLHGNRKSDKTLKAHFNTKRNRTTQIKKRFLSIWKTFFLHTRRIASVDLLDIKGDDLHHSITITFEEMVNGVEKHVLVKKKTRCGECEGSRCLRGTVPTRCWTCYGKGVTVIKNGPYLEEDPCTKCHGRGMTIKHKCPNCFGKGLILGDSFEVFRIPALVENGQVLKYEHRGHAAPSSYSGTLYLTVNVADHPVFKRDNMNIESEVAISYATGIIGGVINVDTLNGLRQVSIGPNFAHGYSMVLEQGGLRDSKSGKVGKHTIKFFFKSPENVSAEEKQLYTELESLQ